MISLHVKKGFHLIIAGRPSPELEILKKPSRIAVLPEKIPFIKPRLKVEAGAPVNIGSLLFEDKRNPELKFLSPGGGRIADITLGPRRVIEKIVIELDDDERYDPREPLGNDALEALGRGELVKRILSAGLWPLMRELPFRDIARPGVTPPAIFVSLSNKEPFQPSPEVYLDGKEALFEYGIDILKKLSGNRVCISISADDTATLRRLNGVITHKVTGDYPANDPGVFLYHTRKTPSDNHAWYLSGQDVVLLSQMLSTGLYPKEKVVVFAGDVSGNRKHFLTRLGSPVSHIVNAPVEGNHNHRRYIAGGIFRGYAVAGDSYLGLYESSLTILPEGPQKEFFGFMRPGFRKPSFSRTFLSSFNPHELNLDCSRHGEERACVNCGYCREVCPVDILPQFTYKSILADDVEEALSHGLLDCVECGLCTYVCPSKIELCSAFKAAKAAYYREMY